jgi:hypothetical protein
MIMINLQKPHFDAVITAATDGGEPHHRGGKANALRLLRQLWSNWRPGPTSGRGSCRLGHATVQLSRAPDGSARPLSGAAPTR